jgi:hypothetical protein
LFRVESESLRLDGAIMTNDDVEHNNAGFLASDPIGRVDEWSPAVLADPCHTFNLSKGHASSTAERFVCHKEKICRFRESNISPIENKVSYQKRVSGIASDELKGNA